MEKMRGKGTWTADMKMGAIGKSGRFYISNKSDITVLFTYKVVEN